MGHSKQGYLEKLGVFLYSARPLCKTRNARINAHMKRLKLDVHNFMGFVVMYSLGWVLLLRVLSVTNSLIRGHWQFALQLAGQFY